LIIDPHDYQLDVVFLKFADSVTFWVDTMAQLSGVILLIILYFIYNIEAMRGRSAL
jgi:hypothetical protein